MVENPRPYQFDFDGACIPRAGDVATFKTFSIRIFQWVPKSSGKGLKKGPTIKRIKGMTAQPQDALNAARRACDELQRNHGFKLLSV